MKKRALYTDILKQISKTKGRFISIILLLTVGIFAYTGLQSTGPYMQSNLLGYYETHRLADIVIQSTYGLEEEDINLLKDIEEIETMECGYTKDTFINNEVNTKILSKTSNLSSSEIVEGRLPENSGEIALDEKVFKSMYKIGDSITFYKEEVLDKENLKLDSYTIVGYIKSAEFVNVLDKGNSTIGDGKTKAFGIILPEDFDMDVYTMARLRLSGLDEQRYNLDVYEDLVKKVVKKIEDTLKDRPHVRLEKIKEEANKKISDAEKEIKDAEDQIVDAENKLVDAKKQIDNGYTEYAKNEKKIKDAETLLLQLKDKLQQTEKVIEEARAKINENKAKLEETYKDLQINKNQVEQGINSVNAGIKSIEETIANIGETPELVSKMQELKLKKQELEKQQKKIEEGYTQYQAYKKEFDKEESKFLEGEKQLNNGKQTYNSGKAEITKGKKELAKAKTKLQDAKTKYEDGKKEFEDKKEEANQKIQDGKKELTDNKEKIENLKKPIYLVNDRSYYPTHSTYVENSKRISKLADIFPVFLFIVAALVSLTTMARMVEEQRGQIGILKALGYNNFDISKKFIIYGLLASVIATVIGVILGYEFLAKFVYDAYSLGNMIKGGPIEYYKKYIIISVGISLFCTVGISLIVLRNSLKTKTAYLLRPKPPKAGSRILLERIKIIWNRLKFIQKVTCRNLFRYKARMIMTIIGIAGCVALLVAGFGIKDSVIDIAPKQYENILLFDDIVIFNKQASNESKEEYENYISNNDNIKTVKRFMYETINAKANNGIEQAINIFVFKNTDDIEDFLILKNRKTKKELTVNQDGVIITEKLASLLDIKKNDKINVYDEDNNQYAINVTEIAEMYGMHYMFMTDEVYEGIFNKDIEENADFVILNNDDEENSNQFVTDLLKNEAVVGIQSSQDMIKMINDFSLVLNSVILILIVCASILAFVVLYTLNNINIAERIRELSTIKVLGFYPKELTMYIYRETIILSIFGVLGGFLFGKLLHYMVIQIVAPDPIMLVPSLTWSVFGLSSLITIIFSIIVMFVMHRKLKKIDMIEALKSVE